MLDQDTIEQQKALLTEHRRRLALLFQQQSRLGDYAPPHILLEIEDTQTAIRELKETLSTTGIAVEDEPNDDAHPTVVATRSHLMPQERRNRSRMLQKVRDFWIKGVLEKSLHNEVLIALNMEERPDAVQHPWDMVIQQSEQPTRSTSSGTRIIQMFDELGGELLILGAPGSGKTTMLLELARDLIARAEHDDSYPIPVVFNLSSWAERRKSLDEWMVDELNTKYDVPRKIGKAWVDADQVLRLLDGLDEVQEEYRGACVEAINVFRQENGLVSIVVCSRVGDYEALNARLKLQGAVLVQALTSEQIETYLNGVGDQLAALRVALSEDEGLRGLAGSPLMLSIMTLAYRNVSLDTMTLGVTIEEQRKRLFDVYVERMFARRGVDTRYSQERAIQWLAWLARMLSQHEQSIFSIERMQPDWLQTRAEQRLYAAGIGVATGICLGRAGGLCGGMSFGLLFKLRGVLIWVLMIVLTGLLDLLLIFGLTLGFGYDLTLGPRNLLFALIVWLIWGPTWGAIGTVKTWSDLQRDRAPTPVTHILFVERVHWSWSRMRQGIIWGLGGAICLGPMFTMIFGLVPGLLIGLLFGPIIALARGPIFNHQTALVPPRQFIRTASIIAIRVGFVGGMGCGLVSMLVILGLLVGLIYGLSTGLIGGLYASLIGGLIGGIAAVLGYMLTGERIARIRTWLTVKRLHDDMTHSERRSEVRRLSWSWARALQGLVWGLFGGLGFGLGSTMGVSLVLMFGMGLLGRFIRLLPGEGSGSLLADNFEAQASILFFNQAFIIVIGVILGVVIGLVRGLKVREVEERTVPNQLIWRSLRNTILVVLICTLVGGLIGGAVGVMSGNVFAEAYNRMIEASNQMRARQHLPPISLVLGAVYWPEFWATCGDDTCVSRWRLCLHSAFCATFYPRPQRTHPLALRPLPRLLR